MSRDADCERRLSWGLSLFYSDVSYGYSILYANILLGLQSAPPVLCNLVVFCWLPETNVCDLCLTVHQVPVPTGQLKHYGPV